MMLAALDWNNTNREPGVDAEVSIKFSTVYLKRGKVWVAKKRYKHFKIPYLTDLLSRIWEVNRKATITPSRSSHT